MISVDFYYDFASPNVYFCHRLLPEIEERTGVQVRYIPCLLGGIFKLTQNQPPFMTYASVKGKLAYEQLEIKRFMVRHDLMKFRWNSGFPVNSLTAMRGAIAAESAGVADIYIEAALTAMWEDDRPLGTPEVLAEVMTAAGLDAAALIDATTQPEVKQQLIANTEAAVERGAFGLPVIFVGDEMFFGKERLGQVEEEIIRQSAG